MRWIPKVLLKIKINRRFDDDLRDIRDADTIWLVRYDPVPTVFLTV